MIKPILFPLIFTIAFALTACQSTKPQLIERHLVVVKPAESMYVCPIKKTYADWQTLNDVEVAKTILELHKNNVRCKASLDAIRLYLDDAAKRLETRN
jgi:hypothetical protein